MKIKTIKVPGNEMFLIPFSDFHIGDKGFTKDSEKKIRNYVKWIKKTPNAYALLNGDILNVATRTSKTSPFEQNLDLKEQIDLAVGLMRPIKERIVGAIDGNHCRRLADFTGYSPMIPLCNRLNVDYMGMSAVYLFQMGHRNRKSSRSTFIVYCHHTIGGGRTKGAKVNKTMMLRDLVTNADLYIGSHNHDLYESVDEVITINTQHKTIHKVRQTFVCSGGYLEWNNSYPEAQMLKPTRMGSPRIHLKIIRSMKEIVNGDSDIKKQIFVSLPPFEN